MNIWFIIYNQPYKAGVLMKNVTHLEVTSSLHVDICGDEWEWEEKSKSSPPFQGEWDLGVLNLERQIGIETSGWLTKNLVHGSCGGLEVSGSSSGSQS